ncbi:hypothetical protein QOT17_004603 [Balamuthia mandrillaris]
MKKTQKKRRRGDNMLTLAEIEAMEEKRQCEKEKRRKKRAEAGCLGLHKWTWIRNNFFITTEVARTKLSKNLRKHIGFGEFVTMDEKQRKWRGASKCIKKVPAKKNDPIGHWITQACVSLQESSRSFIFGLYPFMGTSSEGKSVETKEKVWTWLIDLMQSTTRYLIVCCDCFYLDNSAQALLNEQGVPFHCSVKAAWYKFASAHLGAKLDQMDTWAGMANKNTGEVAVMTWSSEKNVGKKLLLSTSLKKVPGKQRTTNPPGWILYKTMFNACDLYNKDIGKFMWPYRLMWWELHFDDLFHVHVLLNTIAVWIELHKGQKTCTKKELLIQLSEELFERAYNDDLPASRWL